MKFRSLYNYDGVNCKQGAYDKKQGVYSLITDKSGITKPTKVGETNAYQMRQEAKDMCLLSKVIERFVKGDESAIGKVQGGYIDLTDMPTDLMSIHSKLSEAEAKFNRLDVETRKKYDYNFNKYIQDFPNVYKDMLNNAKKVKDNTVNKEVKENE